LKKTKVTIEATLNVEPQQKNTRSGAKNRAAMVFAKKGSHAHSIPSNHCFTLTVLLLTSGKVNQPLETSFKSFV